MQSTIILEDPLNKAPLIPLQIDEKPEIQKCNIRNRLLGGNLVDYINTIIILFVLFEITIVIIVGLVYVDDLNQLLSDAKQNMDDLSIILPEVKETLRIIKVICKAPEYSRYCYSI